MDKNKRPKICRLLLAGWLCCFFFYPAQLDAVANYIAHQKEHHEEKTFQEECRSFFKKYKIDFDERYVWD